MSCLSKNQRSQTRTARGFRNRGSAHAEPARAPAYQARSTGTPDRSAGSLPASSTLDPLPEFTRVPSSEERESRLHRVQRPALKRDGRPAPAGPPCEPSSERRGGRLRTIRAPARAGHADAPRSHPRRGATPHPPTLIHCITPPN